VDINSDDERNGNVSLRGLRVLDVGCGSGRPATSLCLDYGVDVTGVDLSACQLELARKHLDSPRSSPDERGHLDLVHGDIMDQHFFQESFDGVVGLGSLAHLPKEEQTVFLNRAEKWLKPGGLLMIKITTDEVDHKEKTVSVGHQLGWLYWSGWGEEKMLQVLGSLGFAILDKESNANVDGLSELKHTWVIAKKTGLRVQGEQD
jgi:cyclopropane fatty-acyl-phospholipid synthase-like methyltransferase